MKIYVCIPSLNESKTIGHVTELVDQGLQSLQSHIGGSMSATIVNIDSSSNDGTAAIFQKTPTSFRKISVVLPEPRGKGRNLMAFFRLAHSEGATHCLTIDADIQSASPDWVIKMLTPVLMGHADFVTPSYERSRFEGSTTNHFAYPVILGVTGRNVRQPIAGDFAFTSLLFDIIDDLSIPNSAEYYGIDIYLTLTALTRGLRHAQVHLGKKIHNPSFNKLEYMFPQFASTTLSLLRQWQISKSFVQDDLNIATNIIPSSPFSHKEFANLLQQRAQSQLRSIDLGQWGWVPVNIMRELAISDRVGVSLDNWVDVLAGWLIFGLRNEAIDADILGNQLLPFFALRATTFWFASEAITASETECAIRNQARALHVRLQPHLSQTAG